MKRSGVAALGAAVIATFAAGSAAEAVTINFNMTAYNGSIDHNGSSLSDSTFLDIDSATLLVVSVGTGDASGLHEGDPVAFTMPTSHEIIYGTAPGPLPADDFVVLSWPESPAPGADIFTETLIAVTAIVVAPTIDADFIGVTLTGTVTDSKGLFAADTPVTLRLTATEAGDNIPSVSFSNTSLLTPSIPEPSTWVMMALGFGALGYAASRHRKANAAFLSI
jgi:PEP-CTERM motif